MMEMNIMRLIPRFLGVSGFQRLDSRNQLFLGCPRNPHILHSLARA